MFSVFIDSNVVMLATKISDNIPISKHCDTDSEALEFICRLSSELLRKMWCKRKKQNHIFHKLLDEMDPNKQKSQTTSQSSFNSLLKNRHIYIYM